jgi:phosphatidylinositol-3-phosphatase
MTDWDFVIALAIASLLGVAGCGPGTVLDPCTHGDGIATPPSPGPHAMKTVFVIVMENKNWDQIEGNPSAPYLNETLLPTASFARNHSNSGLHPSEPNYLWLEGGTHYGISDDDDPARHHLPNRDHLVSLLEQSGISWRAYEEGIDSTECPVRSHGLYGAKHDPFVFFDDVTDGIDPASKHCIEHIRPLPQLATDLMNDAVARYDFITPDTCNDMHDSSGCATDDPITNGDRWLADWVPRIQQSRAYSDGGVIFITWDESEEGDHPIGLIVASPLAKGGGYSNAIPYSHGSLLRSVQEILGVGPLLCDAANATALSDLFRVPLSP